MADFLMPSLGPDMDEGAIVEWLVKPGDVVHRGEVVAVVQTDKADIDVEVFQDGTVEELLVEPGVTVPVGTPLARLDGAGPTAVTQPPGAAVPLATPGPPATVPVVRSGSQLPSSSRAWSPLVRHLAAVNGVDLHDVTATGPGGGIRRRDVERAIRKARARTNGERNRFPITPRARQLSAALGVAVEGITGTGLGGAITGDDVLAASAGSQPELDRQQLQRRAVGTLMARSKRDIPHYYLSLDVELGAVLDQLRARNDSVPPPQRVLPAALLLQAVAEIPGFNGRWDDERGFVPADTVDLGVAVALRSGGLVAPTLPDAGRADIVQLNTALRDLVAHARTGRLSAAETTAATLTVTNLGDRGATAVYGVIVPPQVALVGIGRIALRPWVIDDPDGAATVAARPVVTLTLSADHRVTSGHEGSRFLDAIATFLHQSPEPAP